jgi:cardiolipin-specific phospholipase
LGTAFARTCKAAGSTADHLADRDDRDTAAAAAFFVDTLEEWRQQQQHLNQFTLIGHSLGGLLAAEYAIQHPDRLDGLVLASPASVLILQHADLAQSSTCRVAAQLVPC